MEKPIAGTDINGSCARCHSRGGARSATHLAFSLYCRPTLRIVFLYLAEPDATGPAPSIVPATSCQPLPEPDPLRRVRQSPLIGASVLDLSNPMRLARRSPLYPWTCRTDGAGSVYTGGYSSRCRGVTSGSLTSTGPKMPSGGSSSFVGSEP